MKIIIKIIMGDLLSSRRSNNGRSATAGSLSVLDDGSMKLM
jgi:hypothetical protein